VTPDEEQELLSLVRQNRLIVEEQLEIAREYKRDMGDPIRRVAEFLYMLGRFLMWFVGSLLTWWGLRDIWNTYILPRFRE